MSPHQEPLQRALGEEQLNKRPSQRVREVKNVVGPVGKAAAVHHHRDKKDDDKKDDDVIEHKGAAVAVHRRRN